MATRKWVLALSVIAAAAPVSAATEGRTRMTEAPAGTAETRYCMRIEALTGTLIELVKCWTREEWARQGVDVDREWAREGVRTIG
ncbi:hypothetical protein SH591_04680 [Sphingomonas sp. LY54]|uniref:hypothetical protein n=1 Tax=Sphingomonas sp. LY54 TaxID=3095343 RepID=UPI002D77DC20|nr:hypothetical protein [Sphingomonas sp. LY54]WRP29482.1 hypothetical protein SH591_04680 [Sphingomonas sp. LY54]